MIEQHDKEGKVKDVFDFMSAFLTNFQQSMSLASPFTFFGMTALIYDKYFRGYISITKFGVIFFILFAIYQVMYFKFMFPAIVRFNSRQSWKHQNPMKEDINKLNEILTRIENKLNKR